MDIRDGLGPKFAEDAGGNFVGGVPPLHRAEHSKTAKQAAVRWDLGVRPYCRRRQREKFEPNGATENETVVGEI